MLATLVASLDRPETIRPALVMLGERHRSYDVVKADFIVVVRALIDTLDVHLGERFSPADRNAWAAFYARVTAMMTTGMVRATAA